METIQEIFNYYDTDNDGFIDEMCFKQIINILGLPINDIEKKQYNYNDLNNYICDKSKKNIRVDKNRIDEILSGHLDANDVDFILNDLFENQKTNNIDLAKISNYLNYLNYQNMIQDQNIPQ